MIFRQLFDPVSSTYTYLLGCAESGEAVVIDPVFEQHARDTALIRELGLSVRFVLDTHVHADHVTAAWRLKQSLGAEVLLSGRYGPRKWTGPWTRATWCASAATLWKFGRRRAIRLGV